MSHLMEKRLVVIKFIAKEEGEWLSFHKNGQLEPKGNFKDGKYEDESLLIFNAMVHLDIKGNFKDGKEEGEWLTYYYENGNV